MTMGSLKQEVIAAGCSIAFYSCAPLALAVNPCTYLGAVTFGVAVYAADFFLRLGLNNYGASKISHWSIKPIFTLTISTSILIRNALIQRGSLSLMSESKIWFLLVLATWVSSILEKYGPPHQCGGVCRECLNKEAAQRYNNELQTRSAQFLSDNFLTFLNLDKVSRRAIDIAEGMLRAADDRARAIDIAERMLRAADDRARAIALGQAEGARVLQELTQQPEGG